MEFLLFLSPASQEIYALAARKVRVAENTAICKKHDIYGWYDSGNRALSICTDRIKKGSDPAYYLNETLLHEATHVAQSCKGKMGGMVPFSINPKAMPLTERRRLDIEAAKRIAGNSVHHLEHEAFWMEDKPEKVKYVLKKYCF